MNLRKTSGIFLAALCAAMPSAAMAEDVTLSLVLVSPADRWEFLLERAEAKFAEEHPDINLTLDAQILPFGDRLTRLRAAAVGGSPLDIVSLDQPEVGEFAAAGFTRDLTDFIDRDLDGLSDWLPAYSNATRYDGGWHAIWAWTDARVLWYWKDLVEKAGVDPAVGMVDRAGYLDSCQRLDGALAGDGIEGCLLIGKPWVADWTLPYVWMNGGDIGQAVDAKVAADAGAQEAWFPMLDSQAWVDALEFARDQVSAGIDPFTEHQFGPAFVSRRYATWLGGSWVYGAVKNSGADMSQLGLLAAFPKIEGSDETATMAGGWALSVPATSENPEIAWEFLKAMLDVDTLGGMQAEFGYLPTRVSFSDSLADSYKSFWNDGGEDRWSKLQDLAPHAYGRPSFPSWPAIGSVISEMVQEVMFNGADPREAAAKAQKQVVVDVLGWPETASAELLDDAGGCTGTDREISAVTPGQRAIDADGNGKVCVSIAGI